MASSRLRFVTLRAHQLTQAAAAAPPQSASRPVETLTARPVTAIADRFEPGTSRRILGRRPSASAAVRTGPTASTKATSSSIADPVTNTSANRKVPQAACSAPRPRKINSEAAPRVKEFESDPRWVAQCAAARDRREQLAARHAQDAKTRWKSAVRDSDQLVKRNESTHATCLRTSTSASATTSAATPNTIVSTITSTSPSPSPSSNSSSAHSRNASPPVDEPSAHSPTTVNASSSVGDLSTKWLAQRAESHEHRQQLAARQQQEEKHRWLRLNAHRAGDDYLPPSCSSALALAPSSNASATDSSLSSSPASSPALDATRSRDSRWAEQTAENYARAEKIRMAQRIKPIRQ